MSWHKLLTEIVPSLHSSLKVFYFSYHCSYELLTVNRQKQSKSLGDLLEMVSTITYEKSFKLGIKELFNVVITVT